MSESPNALHLFKNEGVNDNPIGEGDVALLLKKDGSVQALTFGYDATRTALPDDEKNDLDRHMAKQGEVLFALALAVTHPKIMSLLLDLAADPDVVDPSKIGRNEQLH